MRSCEIERKVVLLMIEESGYFQFNAPKDNFPE